MHPELRSGWRCFIASSFRKHDTKNTEDTSRCLEASFAIFVASFMPMQVKIWKHSSPVQAACLSEAESGLVAGVGRQLDRGGLGMVFGWCRTIFSIGPALPCAKLQDATGETS